MRLVDEIILLNCCKWLQIKRTFFQAVTARLRSETTLPIKWIAARVQIGTAKGAKSVLPHLAQSQDQRKTASDLEPCAQLEFQSTVFSFMSRRANASAFLAVLSLPPLLPTHRPDEQASLTLSRTASTEL